ncbi:MAG: glycosyltransferase family 2 protein [Pseudomonadota bacterium]
MQPTGTTNVIPAAREHVSVGEPGVTVVVPNLNHGKFLNGALSALANQSMPPARILLFDDGSTDDSLEVAEHCAARMPTLEVVRNAERRGVVGSCNAGLERTATEYVYFAAADDCVLDGFLETAVRLLEQHSDAPLCGQGTVIMTEDGDMPKPAAAIEDLGPERYMPPPEIYRQFRRQSFFLRGNATVYRTSMLRGLGGLPDLGPYADGAMIFLLSVIHGACVSPAARSAWRHVSQGYSLSTQRDVGVSKTLIHEASRWLESHAGGELRPGLIAEWRDHATYHVASPLALRGASTQLRELVGQGLPVSLSRMGSLGRWFANALLLMKLTPRVTTSLLAMKLGGRRA